MERVVIIGTSCSGKSHLAKALSLKLSLPHIELDELHWKPNWQERSKEEFSLLVNQSISIDSWVVDGNYSMVRDIVWPKATTIIWLNYSFPLVLFRSIKRSIIRAATKETLFAGNVETFKQSFFSKDSIILWVISTHRKKRRTYPSLLSSQLASHVKVKIFTNPRQLRKYVEQLP